MSIEDQPTQQIRRPQPAAPMPGPLSPTEAQPAAPPVSDPNDGTTGVLSLDDIFEAPAATAGPEAAVAATPAPATAPEPEPAPEPAPPVASAQPVAAPAPVTSPAAPAAGQRRIGAVPAAPARRQPGRVDRLRGDGAAAWQGGLTRSRDWLSAGDNAVIVATALVALLLLLVVALV